MKEVWKNIHWYEWRYQISNLWKVKSLKWKEKILSNNSSRYVKVNLYKNKTNKILSVHRLVADNFLWEQKGMEVNHKNWIKTDNRVENIERVTRSDNLKHSYRILKRWWNFLSNHPIKWKFWSKNHLSKSICQYDLKGNLLKKWGSIVEASSSLWIKHSSISNCLNNKTNTSGGYFWRFNS